MAVCKWLNGTARCQLTALLNLCRDAINTSMFSRIRMKKMMMMMIIIRGKNGLTFMLQ
jgi:hypothetical protein